MSTQNPIADVREDRRTGQFIPTLDGKDISPTSFNRERALAIANQAANKGQLEMLVRELQSSVRDLDYDMSKAVRQRLERLLLRLDSQITREKGN